MSDYELYHHGILGQKWGQKNGPPYPLKAESHSRLEKKDNWRRSLDGANNKKIYERHRRDLDKPKKKELSEEQKDKIKKYVKIGAKIAATALIAYGAYKISTDPKIRGFISKGYSKLYNKSYSIDKALEKRSKGNYVKGILDPSAKPEDFAKQLKIFNPNGTHNECGPSAIAAAFGIKSDDNYLEVKPRASGISTYDLLEDLFGSSKTESIYKQLDNSKKSFEKARTFSGMSEILSNRYPAGSSGIISFSSIPNAFSNGNAGHAFSWSISNDDLKTVSFFDGSNGRINASNYFALVSDETIIDWARLDNLTILPDKISKYFIIKNK